MMEMLHCDDGMFDNIMDDLTHYGVIGMKWGKRKKRPKKPSKVDLMAKDLQDAKKMSYKELQEKVNRLRLEHEYVRLNNNQYNDTMSKIDNTISTIGKISTASEKTLTIYKNMNALIKIGSKLAGVG